MAQQLAGVSRGHRSAEMKSLCLGHRIGRGEQITLLLRLHPLRNDHNANVVREVDDGADRGGALRSVVELLIKDWAIFKWFTR